MTDLPESDSSVVDEATPVRRNLALATLGLSTFMSYTAVLPVFGSRLLEFFSITNEQFGNLMGLQLLGRLPTLMAVGPLIGRLGVRRVIETGLAGMGVSFLIMGLAHRLLGLQAGLLIRGLSVGLVTVALPAFLIALYPALKRRMVAVHLVAFAAPAILYPLVAGRLLRWSSTGGDRAFAVVLYAPFLIIGVIMIFGAVALGLFKQEQVRAQVEAPSTINPRALLSVFPLVIMLLIVLHGAADTAVYNFMAMFMADHFQHLPIAPEWALAGHGIAYVITRTTLAVLPERLGQRAILTLAGPIGGLIIIAGFWWGGPIGVPIAYTIGCLFIAAEYPVLVSEISSRSLGHFGSVFAAGSLLLQVASWALLRVTGRIADITGGYRLSLTVAALGFVAFGLIAAVTGLGKPRPDSLADSVDSSQPVSNES